ncbi:hypothetical protein [Mucilaginibacter glaciei]|uniref:Uncharacterized protein n=1 Tax=Mucilaginibacter glaciei TaxID=2772109 RepID=A0A926NTV7_9SPHI|nr:hypothetical protein [Mucilaginibacter glaciei]MBD1393900.1 hypothetical protein [Mucilaginibacter glaciei]
MDVQIELYDERERVVTTITVEQIAANSFKMIGNEIINCDLTKGTEFETTINKNGQHEIKRILRQSEFTTRRFCLSPKDKIDDYRMLGDELIKRGGFWQIDFASYLTINIPKDFEFDLDTVINDLGLNINELK